MADPFEAIVGPQHVAHPDGALLDGVPVDAVVRPRDAQELAACLGRAKEHGLAVVACGGGTKLARANPCTADRVVRLELGRLDNPIEVQPDEGIATLAAGASIAAVARAARDAGMWTRLDDGPGAATVGGSIAVDPLTLDASLDRRLRNDLLGLEVACADGTLTHCGGRVVKNVTGFDLVRLYCGSFGTLGVMTRAIVRVHPRPEARRVSGRECASLEDACAQARALADQRADPAGVVVVPGEHGVRALWVLQGRVEEVTVRAVRAGGDAASESDWDEARALLAGEPRPGLVGLRLGARASDTLALCAALAEAGAAVRLALPAAGVAVGDCPEDALQGLLERAARQRWLLRLESASPEVRRRFDAFGPEPDSLPLMRQVKRRFDPDGVLSPGRFAGRI